MASSAKRMGVREKNVIAVRRAPSSFGARWPRGPQLDVAWEAKTAVDKMIRERRPKVARPQWVSLPQLVGLRPLDQRLVLLCHNIVLCAFWSCLRGLG
jgi:hypothetical protein